MQFLKQLGLLLAWILATLSVWFGFSWLDFTYKLTDSSRDLWGNVATGLFFLCLASIFIAFRLFFSNIRPLFSDSAVQGFGCGVGLLGICILFAPLVIAAASTPAGGNMWNESSGGGAAIWLIIFTIPAGAVVSLIGLRVFRANRPSSETRIETSDTNPESDK
ncbi:MAG: hypothetical protein RIS80_777 [Actinomycetota bacterium]